MKLIAHSLEAGGKRNGSSNACQGERLMLFFVSEFGQISGFPIKLVDHGKGMSFEKGGHSEKIILKCWLIIKDPESLLDFR